MSSPLLAIPAKSRVLKPLPLALGVAGLALAALAGPALVAQIEGDRGIAPIASTGDFEVRDVAVDVTGKDSYEARQSAWKEAERKAWAKLIAQVGGGESLGDDAIEGMVSSIEVQHEQVGPNRYIGVVNVIFNREKTAPHIGAAAGQTHSAPMLIIPVLYDGGVATVYETRTVWQRAWAEFHTSESVIDYVRPNGGNADGLLINAGQIDRRSRTWWRLVLDRFGATGVLMPIARVQRQWPGGPIEVTFSARYGPDNAYLGSATLTAKDDSQLPAVMAEGVHRLDALYAQALAAGQLAPDPSLNLSQTLDPALVDRVVEQAGLAKKAQAKAAAVAQSAATDEASAAATADAGKGSTYTVQYATPDPQAVDDGMVLVRGVAGVSGVSSSSIAIGGTSVMRVTFGGSLDALAAALRGRGLTVTQGTGALSIRR